MIKITGVIKKYNQKTVLNIKDILLPKNGLVAIVGTSGCGKTTLLNILAGIDVDYAGEVSFKHNLIKDFTDSKRSHYRLTNIGYVFQDFRLFELDSVIDNLMLLLDQFSFESKVIKERYISTLLDLVGLLDKKKNKVNLLSGGEKQRVALARALVNEPSMILCDEPTGALDEVSAHHVMELLASISQKKLVILVTHDEQLANQYCSRKIRLLDGRVTEDIIMSQSSATLKKRIGKSGKSDMIRNMPFTTMLRRAFSILKTRKYRLIINNAMMSMGLLGIGLSLIMSFSINQKIVSGFSSVINDGMIIMSNRYESSGAKNGYSASYENVLRIKETYHDFIDSIGVSYAVNFESFFADRDELFISSTSHKLVLPRFTTRQINDFLWLDNKQESYLVYPRQLSALDNDALVIGLPYNDMVGLCYSLHIERNYESLGDYILKERPLVTLGIANNSWGYEDEQVFHLDGVVERTFPAIFHNNHLWSEYVFEEKMRLPSIDSNKYHFPWEVAKTYFITTKSSMEYFLEKAMFEKNLTDFVFEVAGVQFHPTLCPLAGPCFNNRLLVFHVDKQAIDLSIIPSLIHYEKRLANYIYASEGGYYYHPNSFIAGFAKNVYLSLSQHQLEAAIDADSLVTEEESNYVVSPPNGVLQGSFHTSLLGGVNFSSDLSKIMLGLPPKNLNEIVVSQGLANKLGMSKNIIGQTLHIAVNYENVAYDNQRVEKHYSLSPVMIVGIVQGEQNALYHHAYWSIGFFQLRAGVSAFELFTQHIVFNLKAGEDEGKVIERLQQKYPDFRFTNPMAKVQEGINETMNLLRVVLLAFSSLAIVTSLFLFFIVMFVTIEENKGDILLMHYLGITKSDIRNSFIVCGFMVSLLSFVLAAIEITISDFVVNHVIEGLLGTNIAYVFNPLPIISILLVSIFIAYVATYLAFEKHYRHGRKNRKSFWKILKKDG